MEDGAVTACAETLKKGSLATLGTLVEELCEKNAKTERAAREYLAKREAVTSVVFKVARKLGVKVQNPRPFAEEYAEKWLAAGYGEESLLCVASLAMKLSYGFPETDALLTELRGAGITEAESVKAYCAAREGQLKFLQKLQPLCGVIKKTAAALDTIADWKSRGFSDGMIFEAAKRSAGASSPLPYMNKLLTDWEKGGVSDPAAIPEKPAPSPQTPATRDFRTKAEQNADARSARERWYALRRNAALERAERARAEAEKDADYAAAERERKKCEIELAKAEVFSPEEVPALRARIEAAQAKRKAAMARLRITEEDLLPKYACTKCSDTGFLPDGKMCDCYREE